MKRLVVFLASLLLSCVASAQLGQIPVYFQPATSGGGATPAIIQHVSTTANFAGFGSPNGNAFQTPIAPTGAGDVLVVTVSGLHGKALTLTDSAGDTSPTAICSSDAGTTNSLSYIYAFFPTTGTTWVSLAASTTFAPPTEIAVTEFNNIASVTSQGSFCGSNITATAGTVTPTAFTPTNNNATGGNLIYNYTPLSLGTNTPNCNASGYTAASGFTLLSGDVSAWLQGDGLGYPQSRQYKIQTTSASIASTMTMAGETCTSGNGDTFNSLTIALKIGTAGIATPTAIHVVRVNQITTTTFGGPNLPATFTIPIPTAGNLRVFMFESINTNGWVGPGTVATSSDGCNFTKTEGTNTGTYFFYAQNCSPCPACTATFTNTAGGAMGATGGKFYDVENANASSFQNYTDVSKACSSVTTIANDPSFTPSNTAGITIAMMADGNGPTKSVTSPTGSVFACPTYTGQQDNDNLCSGDAHGYAAYSSASAQNWTWGITSIGSNTCNGLAAAFK